jgi:Xaa-Pro aminopeptidase
MVITIEPGAYLANYGMGARIEDNLAVTVNGAEILSAESRDLK